eukprot:jgi/Mesen1/7839/ME000419S07154
MAFLAVRTSSAVMQWAIAQGLKRLPSSCGDLFTRSRLRYIPREDSEKEVFISAQYPRPSFLAIPLPTLQAREAAHKACTDACLGLSVALHDHVKKRQLKRNLAAEMLFLHMVEVSSPGKALHGGAPQPLFPPASPLPPVAVWQAEVAAFLGTQEASRRALREGAARRQQRARHAARIQRAAYSAASPSRGALFGAPPAAASWAALQDGEKEVFISAQYPKPTFPAIPLPTLHAREVARKACTDACLGLSMALHDHVKKRQLKRNLAAEVRGRHFTAAHPQPRFPPASPLPPDAAAAARSVASAVAGAVAAPLTPPSRKCAPGEIRKPPFGVRHSSLPCVTFPPARPLPPVPKYSWRLPCAPRLQPEKKPAPGGDVADMLTGTCGEEARPRGSGAAAAAAEAGGGAGVGPVGCTTGAPPANLGVRSGGQVAPLQRWLCGESVCCRGYARPGPVAACQLSRAC